MDNYVTLKAKGLINGLEMLDGNRCKITYKSYDVFGDESDQEDIISITDLQANIARGQSIVDTNQPLLNDIQALPQS